MRMGFSPVFRGTKVPAPNVFILNLMPVMLRVGMQIVTLCVTGRGASCHEFPRRAWELS